MGSPKRGIRNLFGGEHNMSKAQLSSQIVNTFSSILSKEKKNIVFLLFYETYRSHLSVFLPIIPLLKKKYNLILATQQQKQDALEKSVHYAFTIPWRVQNQQGQYDFIDVHVDGIDLIITPDQVSYNQGKVDRTFLSKTAKRLYLPHSLIEAVGATDTIDYIAVPSKIAMEKYQKILKGKKVRLLEMGYPKFDESLKNYKTQKKPSNTIAYTPTLRYQQDFVHINKIGGVESMLLEWLLNNTSHKIIYRAHPLCVQNQHTFYQILKVKFAQQKRIIFDEDSSNTHINQADVFLSDCSTSAFSFSLTTLKPSILFAPASLKFNNTIIQTATQTQLIPVAKNLLELKIHLESLYKHDTQDSFKQFREDNIYHIANSLEVFCQQIDSIIKGVSQ